MTYTVSCSAANHDPAELVAAVRAGVESGTIKGEVVEWCDFHHAQGTTLGFCFVGAAPYAEAHKDCNIVEGLIIGPDVGEDR